MNEEAQKAYQAVLDAIHEATKELSTTDYREVIEEIESHCEALLMGLSEDDEVDEDA